MNALWAAIDNRTLLVATALVAGAFAPLMLLVRRYHQTYPGFGHWAASLACIAASAGLHSLRGFASPYVHIIFGNALSFLGVTLYAQGIRMFCGKSWRGRWFYASAVLCTAGEFWFGFVQPDERVRIAILALFQGALLYYSAFSLAGKAPPGRKLSYRFMACVFFVTGSIILLRILALPTMSGARLGIEANFPNASAYLVMLLGTIGIIFGFFLLTYERMTADLREAHRSLAVETSERLDAEKRLAEARHLDVVGRLAGGVAHFFNNQLCVINGYAGMLLNSSETTPAVRSILRNIADAGQRTAQMTDRLLAFSRSKMLRSADLDLSRWIDQMAPAIRAEFPAFVDVRIETPPSPLVVFVETDELARVLLTMARNASEVMPEGGRFSVSVAQTGINSAEEAGRIGLAPGAYARLSLADTGAGMDEATLCRVFEPFFSTKGLANSEGLELGSAFGFVKQSGGTITVRSAPRRGTTFDVYLPLKQPGSSN